MKRSLSCLLLTTAVIVAAAYSAHAATVIGTSFDSKMSLIYDVLTGNLSIEDTPKINPSISELHITSASNAFLFNNLNIQSFPPIGLLSPPAFVNATPHTIDIRWSVGDFLGTGASLGPILSSFLQPSMLLADLTINYVPFGQASTPGDLIFAAIGTTQGNPVLPTIGPNGVFQFNNVGSGQFFDPPLTHGYTYTMESASNFTKIGLPLGLGNNFTVTSSQGIVTNLAGGSEFVFSGAGVSTFKITGISPLVDGTQPDAFPVYLEFSTSFADFNMQPINVPEPGTATLGVIAAGLIVGFARRRRA